MDVKRGTNEGVLSGYFQKGRTNLAVESRESNERPSECSCLLLHLSFVFNEPILQY